MSIELKVPSVGESVTEVEIGEWLKKEGDAVNKDENIAVIETDKATLDLVAPAAGVMGKILKQKGDQVSVNEVVGYLEEGAAPAETPPAPKTKKPEKAAKASPDTEEVPASNAPASSARVMPAAARLMAETGTPAEAVKAGGPGGRILKEDVQRAASKASSKVTESATKPELDAEEEVVPMSLLRRKVAERLVQAQQEAALLTTFNEIDMSEVMKLRQQFQEAFVKRYGFKLGFMSFFVKATVEALKEIPQVNAEVRGTDIVYRNHYDIGIAIGGGRGLVVPVLRQAERLSFAEIEQAIAEFANRVKENKIKPDDLAGGTFTITNGGVYGSLLSTPIVNPPQSGVLGMHAIQDRPVAIDGQVVIRPMMYVALTYDHRIVDGREAVTFLRRIKNLVEQPTRILVEV